VVSLGLEHIRHPLVRQHPVVQSRARCSRAVVTLADVKPCADRFDVAVWDDLLVIRPRAMRRIRARLLVDERARVAEHAVVQFGVEPRHRESRRPATAAAQGHARVRVLGQRDAMWISLRDDLPIRVPRALGVHELIGAGVGVEGLHAQVIVGVRLRGVIRDLPSRLRTNRTSKSSLTLMERHPKQPDT
jgi:hypothetical protein